MRKTSANPRGIALVETLIVAIIAALAVSLAVPLATGVARRGEHHALTAAARDVYDAMQRYFADHGRFPTPEEFDPATLAPLSEGGYLQGADDLVARLARQRLLAYSAPAAGRESEAGFWLLMRHRDYPLVLLVAHSDSVPGSLAGTPCQGVFVYRGGEFRPVTGRAAG